MMPRPARLKFGAIEIGRGVAAAAVVLHHTGNIMAQPRFFGARPFDGHLGNFNVGVDFFFVLSGFIITWIHWPDIGHADRVRGYAAKRFLRIFPPYWGVLFPLMALYTIFPQGGVPQQHDPANVALSIVLLPYVTQPVLGVAWTLTHEIFFYLLFAAIIAGGRRWLLLLPAWAIAILAGHLAGPLPYPLSFLLNPFNLEFILGVAAAMLLRHRTMPWPGAMLAIGIGAFLGLMLFAVHIQDDPLIGRLAFGSAALLFVLGSVELERRRPWELPRWLAVFGAGSYAIYLVHPVALSLFVRPMARLAAPRLPIDLSALILAAVAIMAGLLYHLLLEKRLVAIARRAIGGDAHRPAVAAGGHDRIA